MAVVNSTLIQVAKKMLFFSNFWMIHIPFLGYFALILTVMVFSTACNTRKINQQEEHLTYFELGFYGNFLNDTIDMWCNSKLLFTNAIVTTDIQHGFAKTTVHFYQNNIGHNKLETLTNSTFCIKNIDTFPQNPLSLVFKIKTMYRGTFLDTINITLSQGRFLAVNKTDVIADSIDEKILKPITPHLEIQQSKGKLIVH
jgi:hypothetical protein